MVKELQLDTVTAAKRLAARDLVTTEPRIERISVEHLLIQVKKKFARSMDQMLQLENKRTRPRNVVIRAPKIANLNDM